MPLLLFALSLLLAACGGGGDQAPIEENAVTVGTIARFGSVVTNDVAWDTRRASLQLNGIPGEWPDLGVGDVVAVTGDLDDDRRSGVAARVERWHAVQGPITAIDRSSDPLASIVSDEVVIQVLGQWVVLDNSTVYGAEIVPGSSAGLAVGDFVSVSGYPGTVSWLKYFPELGFSVSGSYDAWQARRLAKQTPSGPLIASGVAAGVDPVARRFTVGELSVDYSSVPGGTGADLVADQARLWVRGSRLGPDGALIADEIVAPASPVDGLPLSAWVDVEGLLENRAETPLGAPDIHIAGVPMTLSGALTGMEGGISRAQGHLSGNGRVSGAPVQGIACSASSNSLRIRAPVETVDVNGRALVILGQRIELPGATRLHDRRAARQPEVDLGDLDAGDWLDVRACLQARFVPGAVVYDWLALIVEREEPDVGVTVTGETGLLSHNQFVMRQLSEDLPLVIQLQEDTVFVRGPQPPYVPETDPADCLGLPAAGAEAIGRQVSVTVTGTDLGSGAIAATAVQIRSCVGGRPVVTRG